MIASFTNDSDRPDATTSGSAACWRLGLDGTVLAVSRVGGEIGAGVGCAWRDGWPVDARPAVDSALAAALRGETAAFRAEIPQGADGRIRLEVVVTAMCDANGEAEGLSATAREAAVGLDADVLADLGHDLRTPLHGLLAGAAILEAHPLAQTERELAGMMRASALALAARLRIPLDPAAAMPVAPATGTVVRGGRLQILVADDHPTNRRVAELILGDFACVRTVNDGREAIEAYTQQAFDLVLMDIQMPLLDGVSAVREIRRFEILHDRPRTPIAMLTASIDPAHVAASRAAGADQHIAKPFTPNLLVNCVQQLLHARAA